ncbi:tetratricopeptide repeat protein [Shouchella shacheensis]|uniref:tetratricopeptide repeat protein n=1 Tax=Shouchella shacheensis TaxID=1649580 RepID=UPI0007400A29|nr:tetratricopeptide repeat protein [Shouchella shacheensis]
MNGRKEPQQEKQNLIPFYQSGDYFFNRGLKAFQKKHLGRAVKLLERAVKLTSTEPIFHIQLAAVLSELEEYERSNMILEDVLRTSGDSQPLCYFLLANNEVYLGDFHKAEKQAKQYLQLEPDGQFATEARELLELFEEDEEEEKEPLEDVEDFLREHERARRHLRADELHLALPLLDEIVENYPDCWAAHNHLAEAQFRSGKPELAFSISNQVLEGDPGNLLARCNLALFHLKMGNAKQVEWYRKTLTSVVPMDVDHAVRVTVVLCALGEYQVVLARRKDRRLRRALEDADLLRCYGVACFHTGDSKAATAYLQMAVNLGDERAKQHISDIENGRFAQVTYSLFSTKSS